MEQRKTQPTIVDGWFSTHPLEESRIQQARRLIQAKGADQTSGLMQNLPSYAAFRKAVSELPEPPAPPPQGQ
jgi:predicted Zn-dependent protease